MERAEAAQARECERLRADLASADGARGALQAEVTSSQATLQSEVSTAQQLQVQLASAERACAAAQLAVEEERERWGSRAQEEAAALGGVREQLRAKEAALEAAEAESEARKAEVAELRTEVDGA